MVFLPVQFGTVPFYTVHITSLSSVINSHHLSYHIHAGDTNTFVYSESKCFMKQFRNSFDDILHWMTEIRLKLNACKAEFLIIGTQGSENILIVFYPQSCLPAVSTLCQSDV